MSMVETYQSDSTSDAGMNSRKPYAMFGGTTPVSRKAEEYRLTFHALEKMEQRSITTRDIAHIIQKGHILDLRERIGFRLALEELPEKEENFGELEQSKDTVVIVKPKERIIVTARPYAANIHNYRGNSGKNGHRNRFNNEWLSCGFEYPSEVLFSFQASQTKELLGITSDDIKQIVYRGWRLIKWQTLSLFEPKRFYFDNNQQPRMKGTTMIIDRKNATVVDFLKSDPFQFLFSWNSNIHKSRRNERYLF